MDEVDQLESKNQDVLYTVFEWPALAGSRLSLVGIANTLDLTDRVLPRLQVSGAGAQNLCAGCCLGEQCTQFIIENALPL